jgi:hypothetical protein
VAACQPGRDLCHCLAFGTEPSGFYGPIWWRRRRASELEDRCDVVSVGRADPAVPSCTGVWIFGSKCQRETGKAGGTALATKERQPIGSPFFGVVGIRIRPDAGCVIEIVTGGVVDQIAKLLLPPSEEIRVVHCLLQLISGVPGPLLAWLSG